MYGYVYLTENLVTLDCYIGKHKSSIFDPNYKGSGTLLTRAIKKYGWDNFVCQPIAWANTEQELFDLEQYWGDRCDVVDNKLFYNLKRCGEGGSQKGLFWITNYETGEHKKIPEYDMHLYLDNGWFRGGYITTSEAVAKRAKSNRGKKRSQETKQNISKALIGKPGPYHKSESVRISALKNCETHNKKIQKKVICIETNVIYESLHAAERETGIAASNIHKVCNFQRPKAGGYTWRYIEER